MEDYETDTRPTLTAYKAKRSEVGSCNACDAWPESVIVVRLRTIEVRLCESCKDRLQQLFKDIR
jgi:hypothetical protein